MTVREHHSTKSRSQSNKRLAQRIQVITEVQWGMKVSAGTVSDLNQKMYERIEVWRNEPIKGK